MLSINTNATAATAARQLGSTHSLLTQSLSRLSSGKRINSPSDDAGGLAVSVKMSAAINRTSAVQANVGNAISYLQTQDGALQSMGSILERISELKTLYGDVTKSSSDKANYNTEFTELVKQLNTINAGKFNGVTLFGANLSAIGVNEDSTQKLTLTKTTVANIIASINKGSLAGFSLGTITSSIASVATLRATNGAQTNRLQFASDMLSINKVNLEAANSRVMDTDIASESTRFAKLQILAQANSAMLAQANTLPQTAARLIGG